jgi:nitroreductase
MDVLTAIKNRRSVGRPSQKPVARDVIETLLDAAAQAPSHHNTFPWRFHVLTGEARVILGERLAAALRRSLTEEGQDPESKQGQALLKAEAAKTMRAPVLIAVTSHPSDASNVVEREEHFACAAAVQNMLLAAHSLGLGVMWRTGEGSESPEVKEWLGLAGRDQIIALVYVGWPESDAQVYPLKRRPWSELTEWRGYD